MKKQMQKHEKAFSLVELVVVMAVMGILIVLVWVLLDPMEQIRKAQDSSRISNAKELAGAIERYYVTSSEYPWNRQNEAFTAYVRDVDRLYHYDPTNGESDMNWIWTLVDMEEIKEAGAKSIFNSGEYHVFKSQGTSGTYPWVCFEPKSKMHMLEAAQACDERAGRTAPKNERTFEPCQTTNGTIADPLTTGYRNLLCVTE